MTPLPTLDVTAIRLQIGHLLTLAHLHTANGRSRAHVDAEIARLTAMTREFETIALANYRASLKTRV